MPRHDYLPIAEHGIIGDLHSAALVGTDGTIDWYCPGRFDAPSVFASILDAEKGGFFRIMPVRCKWTSKQLYVPDTNVLLTRFLSEDGVSEVMDFMPVEERQQGVHRQRLIRRVLCVKGAMQFTAEIEPRFDYGRAAADIAVTDAGAVLASPDLTLSLSAPVALERTAEGVRADFSLEAGQSATFVLEQAEQPRPYSEDDTRELFNETVDYWLRWIAAARYQGRWREIVRRSALTLKLLTYQPTGALIAAATTSLPEELGGGRNWDYRFTWIRDAAFSLYALLGLGFTEEAAAFGDWLTDRFREERKGESGPLQVMYAIDGSSDLEEEILDHLEGYCGSAPVRIGNGAADQLQLDIYGELVDSVYLFNKHGRPISHDAWMDLPTWSTGSAGTGTSRTRGSGRRAAAARTSRTRGSCAGWPSSGRSASHASEASRRTSSPGGRRATTSTDRSWTRVGTRSAARSCSTTARTSSTPRTSSCRS